MTSEFILMADVVGSSQKPGKALMASFQAIVSKINADEKVRFKSPASITLGDEFQSVVKSPSDGMEIIFSMEEEIILQQAGFSLRYILLQGTIDTAINTDTAYGMLGDGLRDARQQLEELKKEKEKRVCIRLENKELTEVINAAFMIYSSLLDQWSEKDRPLVAAFLQHKDYKKVAEVMQKDKSLMWRREQSLRLSEYKAIRQVIAYLIRENES